MAMVHRRLLSRIPLYAAAIVVIVAGCGGDETQPNEDHTPESYTVLVDDVPVTTPYTFEAGQTVVVRLKFYNAAEEDLDEFESGHFAKLTFNPVTLATAVRQADHHFQFDVTGGNQGSGTVTVGYGHDDAAAEVSFPPAPVTVTGGGNPNPN